MTSLHEAIAALADEWQKPDDGLNAGWLTAGVRYNCARELRDLLDRFPADPAPSEHCVSCEWDDQHEHPKPEGVGTGAGEGAPRQDTGSAWVTRSADCPEAPAQAHPLAPSERVELTEAEWEQLREAVDHDELCPESGDYNDAHGLFNAVTLILSARLAKVEAEKDLLARGRDHWREVAAQRAEKAEAERDDLDRGLAAVLAQRDEAEARADALARKVGDLMAISVETAQERDRLAEQVAAVEALVREWESRQAYNRAHMGEMLRDTPGPGDFRAALTNPGEALRADRERVWAEGANAAIEPHNTGTRMTLRAAIPFPDNPYADEGGDR